ncbi:MAG: efflux RND transporter periplasmic adaptor subunit, partial [Bacteroidales bacterium]|nr:efflux RND transporter periplasmic adaptor subunit [Bacteroidales bacterium]
MKTKNILIYALLLAAGLCMGWLLFGGHGADSTSALTGLHDDAQVWTCSMHPQVRQPHAGKCPLCAMDLIPLQSMSASVSVSDNTVMLSKEAVALANIQTMTAAYSSPVKESRLY